jgi:hypothetical protein
MVNLHAVTALSRTPQTASYVVQYSVPAEHYAAELNSEGTEPMLRKTTSAVVDGTPAADPLSDLIDQYLEHHQLEVTALGRSTSTGGRSVACSFPGAGGRG